MSVLKHPQNDLQAEKERLEKLLQESTDEDEKCQIEESLKKICEDLQERISSGSGKSVVFILEKDSKDKFKIKCDSCQSSTCSVCHGENCVSTSTIMDFMKENLRNKNSSNVDIQSLKYCDSCKKIEVADGEVQLEKSSLIKSCNSCLSFETCPQCESSKSSVALPVIKKSKSTFIAPVIEKSQTTVATPSCLSLANCSLCKKAYSIYNKKGELSKELFFEKNYII
jgi:hypothetical protein